MLRRKTGAAYVIWIFVLTTLGCQDKAPMTPHIRYGEETCDRCGMIISEQRFASAYRTDENVMRKFDSLGCAVLHQSEENVSAEQFWTYDYYESTWLETTQAFFVESSDLLTPMGYGIVAVKTKHEAETLAQETKGQILEFSQLRRFLEQ